MKGNYHFYRSICEEVNISRDTCKLDLHLTQTSIRFKHTLRTVMKIKNLTRNAGVVYFLTKFDIQFHCKRWSALVYSPTLRSSPTWKNTSTWVRMFLPIILSTSKNHEYFNNKVIEGGGGAKRKLWCSSRQLGLTRNTYVRFMAVLSRKLTYKGDGKLPWHCPGAFIL
jgi:hypothetical protein